MLALFAILLTAAHLVHTHRELSPAARLAAALLAALGAPVLSICVAATIARFHPLGPGLIGLVLVNLLVALRHRRHPSPGGWTPDCLRLAILAALVATLSALLGGQPNPLELSDPWAHLAWGRDLPGSLHLYPPALPATYALLGWPMPLVGAFRLSAALLHLIVVSQFLALAERSGRAWAGALPALLYLIVPISYGKFDPPRPELLGAALIVGSWWLVMAQSIDKRLRAVGLAVLSLWLFLSHVSPLEVVHVASLTLAILMGVGGGNRRDRGLLVAAVLAGGIAAVLVSPWNRQLIFGRDQLPLLENVPGLIYTPSLRALAWRWGLDLVASLLVLGAGAALAWRRFDRRIILSLAVLACSVFVLLAPIPLARLGIRLPIQIYTDRLLLSASLYLCMILALLSGSMARVKGRIRLLALSPLLIFVAYKLIRPSVPGERLVVAISLLVVIALLYRWAGAREGRRENATSTTSAVVSTSAASTVAVAAAAAAVAMVVATALVRAWIWTPVAPPAVRWLENHGAPMARVVTNWPATNSLDALSDRIVVDGLAGRDANIGLHRGLRMITIRDSLFWCADHEEKAADTLARFLQSFEDQESYVLVDDRFHRAWEAYAKNWKSVSARGDRESFAFLRQEPCHKQSPRRLLAMRQSLEDHPEFELVHAEGHQTLYRFRSATMPDASN